MSLLHSWTCWLLSSPRSRSRIGAETRRDALEAGSRTSMTSSSRAQSTTVVSGEAPRTSRPLSCDAPPGGPAGLGRRPSVEVEHHDVGAQPMGRPDDGAGPVFMTDHLAALLAQYAIHAETHDRSEVSEQDAGT